LTVSAEVGFEAGLAGFFAAACLFLAVSVGCRVPTAAAGLFLTGCIGCRVAAADSAVIGFEAGLASSGREERD
jgi:hypothetical protein